MLAYWEFQKWFRRTLPHIKKCPDVDLYFTYVSLSFNSMARWLVFVENYKTNPLKKK